MKQMSAALLQKRPLNLNQHDGETRIVVTSDTKDVAEDSDIDYRAVVEEAEIAAADGLRYRDRSAMRNAAHRFPALLVTLGIELLVAFVIVNDMSELETLIGRDKAHVFTGFMAVISAISGNVGLQASTAITRQFALRLPAHLTHGALWCKEMASAILLALAVGCFTGGVSGYWANSLRVGLCCGIAQVLASSVAGLTGSLAPFLFKRVCNGDPALWAGPLETGFQDIIGSVALFKLSKAMIQFLLPDDWS